MIRLFDLKEHLGKSVKKLSGGNKRKLQIALAIMGRPIVIILDEPTAGIDVTARRAIWRKLLELRSSSAILLTTHSMEEADTICTRIGIVVNGKMQCEGTPQELKDEYGRYIRIMVTCSTAKYRSEAEEWLKEVYPSANIVNSVGRSLHLDILAEGKRYSEIFGILEESRTTRHVQDYTVSQTNLEQVFLDFARYQEALRK